jgi:HlyD family secretion protein
MKTLAATLIGVALLPASVGPRPSSPTVLVDVVTVREVRRASEVGTAPALAVLPDTLLVERPIRAVEGITLGMFVVSDLGVLVRRPVTFGHAAGTLIEVVSGVAPGDRVVVSDMSAWDAFDRLRLRR